ncbi:DUF4912 domain-containing protein [Brevibacillus sp. H7]|uniref:DUF4912 domain-containing protein n=1 Tax=Brevibacillus sp. H7 TaxID=3349138 RepID=UPI003809F378
MLERILQLRSQSMPIAQIAKECGLTVGQVKYQLRKTKRLSSIERENQSRKLPSFYARDRMKLMVQGPSVLYVYWEITWARMRMVASYLQADYRQIQKGIRLYDVTDRLFDGANAHHYRDVTVSDEASSWYIYDVQPGRTYIVDFGLFHDGRFCPILRSEPAATPRNQRAGWGEPLIEPAGDTRYPAWFENFSSYSLYTK